MKGIVIHCKNRDCHKLLAKNVNLPIGGSLEVKCFHCGKVNCICSEKGGVSVKSLSEISNPDIMELRLE